MGLITKPTTLIDNEDSDYMYIGKCIVSGATSPQTNAEIWEITKITFTDGKATKIEHGINKKNKAYLAWDKRKVYNYI